MSDDRNLTESTSSSTHDPETVAGERGVASVNRIRSVQSRVSSALAVMVFSGLTLAGLAWYYSSALGRSHRPRAEAVQAVQRHVEGEMGLPPIGPLSAPSTRLDLASRLLGPPPAPVEQPIEHSRRRTGIARPTDRAEKTPLERQLSGLSSFALLRPPAVVALQRAPYPMEQ